MFSNSSPKAGTPAQSATLMLLVICAAQFLVVIDVVVLMVAGPALAQALGATELDLQWVFNAYALAFGGLLLLAGRAGDRLGHRHIFAAGALVFALASLIGGLSTSMPMLIAARALQGVGAAMLAANSLALLTLHFPTGPARLRALGLFASSATVGVASGTLLGGLLTGAFGWSSVLLINVPLGLAMAWSTKLAAGEARDEVAPATRMDWAGAATATLGFGALTLAIAQTSAPSPATLVWWGAAAVLLIVFVVVERRSPAPLLDLNVLRNRPVAVANALIFVHSAGPLTSLFFGSLYFQQVRGLQPLETGLLFLPFALASIVGARTAPVAMAHIAPRGIASIGFVLMSLSAFALSFLPVAADRPYLLLTTAAFAIGGFGSSFSFVSLTEAATASARKGEAGMVSGLANTSLQMGGASVLALLITVTAAVPAATAATHITTFTTAAVILLVGAVAGFFLFSPSSRQAASAGQ
ncbi:MFS transporter [Aminobacter sp. UC22_36]|uniref:MFS transporter n=1 Tax=Aminobacter sp. UC22_36 TaxID=3374549 RepID=UPI003756B58B